jgi:hypothetical protein
LMCKQEIINMFQLKGIHIMKDITILGSLSYPASISEYNLDQ